MVEEPKETTQSVSQSVSFTYDWYKKLLNHLSQEGFRSARFDEPAHGQTLYLRHDVDLSPYKALKIGEIESANGFSSTFFFLVGNPLYNIFDRPNREIIRELEDLGHSIGVHFSTHQYASFQIDELELENYVRREQRILNELAMDCSEFISFHCPPNWVLGREYRSIRHTYEPTFFNEIGYIADSGQRWRDDPPVNLSIDAPLQLLTHPGLWGDDDRSYSERIESSRRHHLDRIVRLTDNQLKNDQFDVDGLDSGMKAER